jgi:hypothetical protein
VAELRPKLTSVKAFVVLTDSGSMHRAVRAPACLAQRTWAAQASTLSILQTGLWCRTVYMLVQASTTPLLVFAQLQHRAISHDRHDVHGLAGGGQIRPGGLLRGHAAGAAAASAGLLLGAHGGG